MDPYDSDSSLEDEDFTETATLLGYPSEELIEDTISHLGGWPSWPDNATPPPGEFANCKVCSRPMALLLELHGDLPADFPADERRLYVFGCSRKACVRKPGSVRALRATKKVNIEELEENEAESDEKEDEAQEPTQAPPKQDLGASLFGAGALTGNISANANPFSSQAGDNTTNNANPFATPAPGTAPPKPSSTENNLSESFADKVRISTPSQLPSTPPSNFKPTTPPEESGPLTPWPDQSAFPPPYPNYYLDADYETLDRTPPPIPENVTIDNSEDPPAAGGKDAELKDTFESELDKAFLRFSTRLAHNPEQVLRYEFRGEPLLYSYVDDVGKRLYHSHHQNQGHVRTASGGSKIPRCEYCGTERVFELQLVPHTISVLEDGREKLGLDAKEDAGMEWGTIILGVCGKDCGPKEVGVTGWREEWAGVQWEELMK